MLVKMIPDGPALGAISGGATIQIDRRPIRHSSTEPNAQLGKIVQPDSANVGELERQVSDSANEGERPQTDTDAP